MYTGILLDNLFGTIYLMLHVAFHEQRYYSSDKINFTFAREVDGRSDADKHVIALRDSVQDHIVIEPDIEIQTLSDEFQMEFEDSEIKYNAVKFLNYLVLTCRFLFAQFCKQ